jgi:hypothetical protein
MFIGCRWNAFGINIDEDIVKATAERMVSLGLRDVGWGRLLLNQPKQTCDLR